MDSKHTLIKTGDWSTGKIDLVFVENNFFLKQQASDEAATIQEVQNALHCLYALWFPDSITVCIENDAGQNSTLSIALDASAPLPDIQELLKKADSTHILQENARLFISSDIYGWNRIAIPAGAGFNEEWHIVDADGMCPRPYKIKEAGDYQGVKTIWFRMLEASPATNFSLYYQELDVIELKLTLGPVFFNPLSDIRSADQLIRGVRLSEWQKANAVMLENAIRPLKKTGTWK